MPGVWSGAEQNISARSTCGLLVLFLTNLLGMASSTIKADFGKFDSKGNFSLWQQRMKDLLVQNRIYKVLVREKPEKMSPEDWKELEEIAFSTIKMCLADQVLPEIGMETTVKGL